MNSIADQPDEFTVFNPALDQFFDIAKEIVEAEEGSSAIFTELKSDYQRYWIANKIAEGGSKTILKVKDSSTNRHVAMAILKDKAESSEVEAFLREARLTASLQHPNIMPVYDIGVNSADEPYFTMKLIEYGHNLGSLAKSVKRISGFETLASRLEVFLKICDGVSFAHANGILHLDLKPENIQLDSFGQVLICDWGLARFVKGRDTVSVSGTDEINSMDFLNLTVKGLIQGTPGFMAPEQATTEKRVKDERTDIYALGALLYYLLCFHSPLKIGPVKKMLSDTLKGNTVPLAKWRKKLGLPSSLIKVSERAMSLNPENRYQSVTAIQDEIRAYMDGYATMAENAGFRVQLALFYSRNKFRVNLLIMAVLMFIGLTMYFIDSVKESEHKARLSEARALESEKKALANLDAFKQAQEANKQLGSIAAIQKNREAMSLATSKEEYKKAFKLLKYALTLDSDQEATYANLGWLSFTAQKFDEAIVYYKEALKRAKDSNSSRKSKLKEMLRLSETFEGLVDEETGLLDEELINAGMSRFPERKFRIVFKHLIYRHRNNLLENE